MDTDISTEELLQDNIAEDCNRPDAAEALLAIIKNGIAGYEICDYIQRKDGFNVPRLALSDGGIGTPSKGISITLFFEFNK